MENFARGSDALTEAVRERRRQVMARCGTMLSLRFAGLLSLGLSIGCATGCMTVAATRDEWPSAYFYGGVRWDFNTLREPGGHGVTGTIANLVIVVIDLPFSIVGDTLLLPLHTWLWIREQRQKEEGWVPVTPTTKARQGVQEKSG